MPKPRIVRWIIGNWWLKLLAFIAAILLWLFARLERDYTRELKLALDTSLLPPQYVVVDKNVDSVSVEIEAKGRHLFSLRKYNPMIVLPLSTMKQGSERLRIGPENVNLPEEIQIRSMDPYQIRLEIERRAHRKVRVIVQPEGIPAQGYAVSSINAEKTVDVYGPQKVVSKINQLFTESLEVEGKTRSFSDYLQVQLPDTAGLVVKPSSVLAKVEIEPETTVVLSGIKVGLKGRPVSGQAYLLNKQARLTLSGPVSLLGDFDKKDVEVSISVSSLTPGDYRLPADVSVPPGIKVEESEPTIFRLLVR